VGFFFGTGYEGDIGVPERGGGVGGGE